MTLIKIFNNNIPDIVDNNLIFWFTTWTLFCFDGIYKFVKAEDCFLASGRGALFGINHLENVEMHKTR